MFNFLSQQPALIIPCLALLIPIVAIIFGTVTSYMHKVRQAELDAQLKHEMLERGMSADEIRTVLEASSAGARSAARSKSCGKDAVV
jgi:hypothetical protein